MTTGRAAVVVMEPVPASLLAHLGVVAADAGLEPAVVGPPAAR